MDEDRLTRQIAFVIEIDRLKSIIRRTRLFDNSRQENSAEHSFHLAMMALVLSEHSKDEGIDMFHVIRMVLVHDLVEIHAGDSFLYDASREGMVAKEREAADRVFGVLPDDQAKLLKDLWEEFEARVTPEARFAAALDRIEPILQNYHTQGYAWKMHGITRDRVEEANRHIAEGSPILWEYVLEILDDAERKGYFPT